MRPEQVVIVPYRDGPYLVRGPLVLRDQEGRRIEVNRRTVALCRCGKSQVRPFCDGTHRLIRFRAGSEAENVPPERRDPGQIVPERSRDPAAPSIPLSSHLAGAEAGLRRAAARLSTLLEDPEGECGRPALPRARSLVSGAVVLLERTHPRPSSDEEAVAPCLCLVHAAVDALAPMAEQVEAAAEVAGQLRSIALTLAPEMEAAWPT